MEIKKIIYATVSISISILIFLILIELHLRFNNEFALQRNKGLESVLASEERYQPADDIILGYEHIPNKVYEGHLVVTHVNSIGLVDKERNIDKKKNVYRICVVGDSITEDGRYVQYLEDKLNKNKNMKYDFEVWNCGVGGYGALQYYANIKSKVIKYYPDMILICFCLNDMGNAPVVYKNSKGEFVIYENNYGYCPIPINKTLFLKLHLYRFIICSVSKFAGKKERTGIFARIPDVVAMNEWAIGNIQSLTKKNDISVYSIIVPFLKSNYLDYEQVLYQDIKQTLNKYNIKYLDLHGKFKDVDNIKWRKYKDDEIHPSKEGHKLIADKIYNYLMGNLNLWYREIPLVKK